MDYVRKVSFIKLLKYTYMMKPEKVLVELDKLWGRYEYIIGKIKPTWDEINEARVILFLIGDIYCEKIVVEAIERRLHLLKERLELVEFFDLIDKNSSKLKEMRKDNLFNILERFYRIVKKYKNKYVGGKYYLDEEKFIKKYNEVNPDIDLKIGYSGKW